MALSVPAPTVAVTPVAPAAPAASPSSIAAGDGRQLAPGRLQSLRQQFEGLALSNRAHSQVAARGQYRGARSPVDGGGSSSANGIGSPSSASDSLRTPTVDLLQSALFLVDRADEAALVRHLVRMPDHAPQQPVAAAVVLRTFDGLRSVGETARATAFVLAFIDGVAAELGRAATDDRDANAAIALLANAVHLAGRYERAEPPAAAWWLPHGR